MSWTDLTGKVVIITGGAAGIGLSVAKGFVEVGARVVIADFAEDVGAKAVIEASEAGPGEAIFARCDVTSKQDVEAMVKTTVDQFG
ncbi:MAG: SDR family NAD(P)-dependent oxidoreductase, partial [Opitutales bacterium]